MEPHHGAAVMPHLDIFEYFLISLTIFKNLSLEKNLGTVGKNNHKRSLSIPFFFHVFCLLILQCPGL